MIFYTWNVISTLYPECIMSCNSFINDSTKVIKETHSKTTSHLVYILDSRVLIYYEYVCIGPLMLTHIYFCSNYYHHKIMNMWVTNQNTLRWSHVLWLWSHGFWWWGHEYYDRASAFNLKVYEHKLWTLLRPQIEVLIMDTVENT